MQHDAIDNLLYNGPPQHTYTVSERCSVPRAGMATYYVRMLLQATFILAATENPLVFFIFNLLCSCGPRLHHNVDGLISGQLGGNRRSEGLNCRNRLRDAWSSDSGALWFKVVFQCKGNEAYRQQPDTRPKEQHHKGGWQKDVQKEVGPKYKGGRNRSGSREVVDCFHDYSGARYLARCGAVLQL